MIANTSQEVMDIVNQAFDFSVTRGKLIGPNGQRTPHYGLFRSDNGQCVGGAVSDRYEPHTTEDVVALAGAAASAFDGQEMVVSTYFNGGHNVVVGPTKDSRIEIAKNDGIFPRFILSAGYDANAFKAAFGAYRDQCTNLQMLSASSSITESLRHTQVLRNQMPELISMFGAAALDWENTADVARRMKQRRVDIVDFITRVFPSPEAEDSERTKDAYHTRIDNIVRRIEIERRATGDTNKSLLSGNAWEAYQGIQGYVQHDQRRNGNPNRLERALLGLKSPQVKLALELATAV